MQPRMTNAILAITDLVETAAQAVRLSVAIQDLPLDSMHASPLSPIRPFSAMPPDEVERLATSLLILVPAQVGVAATTRPFGSYGQAAVRTFLLEFVKVLIPEVPAPSMAFVPAASVPTVAGVVLWGRTARGASFRHQSDVEDGLHSHGDQDSRGFC